MRFGAKNDENVIKALFAFGVLAKRQLQRLFWRDNTERAMEKRISLLHSEGYVCWPSIGQYKAERIPESVYWLGWRGALFIAQILGIEVKEPRNTSNRQLELLQAALKKQGIHWLRQPSWNGLRHDIAVADFRLEIQDALEKHPSLYLENWIPEHVFRADTDLVKIMPKAKDGTAQDKTRGLIPDGYFVLADQTRKARGEPYYRLRFLLELDMGSHSVSHDMTEKIAAGAAYLRSEQYKARFGVDAGGYWLVVVTRGEERLENLMRVTKQMAASDADKFYFTTLKQAQESNPLSSAIWMQVGSSRPVALVP